MPCNSDYLAPTDREKQLQHTAALLVYVLDKTLDPVSPELRKAATDSYCTQDYVSTLCAVLTTMREEDPALFNLLVYDAHQRESRELATWWEDHQRADAERIQRENARATKHTLRKQALEKLTPTERAALDLKD